MAVASPLFRRTIAARRRVTAESDGETAGPTAVPPVATAGRDTTLATKAAPRSVWQRRYDRWLQFSDVLVLIRGQDSCYVIYREFRYKDVPLFAVVLHVSNPDLFHRAVIPLTRHLLVRHRLVATLAELRIIGHQPRLSFKLNAWPKMYGSASLEPGQIDNLYSELVCVCVPW
jgi:hypothetical protein